MFYIIARDEEHRNKLIRSLRDKGIHAVFHYQSLHASLYGKKIGRDSGCEMSDFYTNCLVRLPLYGDIKTEEVERVCGVIKMCMEKCYEAN